MNRNQWHYKTEMGGTNRTVLSKWYIFKRTTELGAIHDTIDWESLAGLLPQKKTLRGAPPWLPPQGFFGLMFLKHYTGLSDEKLMERFHTDWGMQLFCGVLLQENERIRDNAFVSKVRSYLSKHLDLNQLQQKLVENWKQQGLAGTHILMMDATCYESYIRYPTDVKLLWECCEHLWAQMIPQVCKTFKLRQPRSKYIEQRKKYLRYSKLKRKTYRKTKARKKALLYLLIKGIEAFQTLLNQTQGGMVSSRLRRLFKTIKVVYLQQEALFRRPSHKVKDRIVSLHKPYVRPIVRGKENKPVEFGMKVHMNQTAGVNMIEYASRVGGPIQELQ